MTCLAFEFTSDRRSVALGRDGELLAEVVHDAGRRTPVFDLVEKALRDGGVERRGVDRIAVGIGPGSYTGIRIAISAAQGWALGSDVEVVAVDSFEALRRAAVRRAIRVPWTALVDAQRQEYAARTWDGTRWTGPLRLASMAEILGLCAAGERFLGPDMDDRIGAPPQVLRIFPEARDLLAIAAESEPCPPETLAPTYLREAAFVKAPVGRDLGVLLP